METSIQVINMNLRFLITPKNPIFAIFAIFVIYSGFKVVRQPDQHLAGT